MKNRNPVSHKGKVVTKAWGYELWIRNTEKYCGKLLVFNKDAKFSMHYHLLKEETWYVSKGTFRYIWIDTTNAERVEENLKEGDIIHLNQGQPHQLIATSQNATIFEISTQHFDEDSYRVEVGDSQK
jgi:mannose-6-phosphate isomerase-like protein (cupin superfamily)